MGNGEDEKTPPWYPRWKNHSWCYDFYVEGKRYRRSTGVCDPQAIEIAIKVAKGVYDAAWERELSPFPTFEEAADLYLADINRNREYVERLKAYFGPFIRIDEISPFMIKQCMVALTKPGWTSTETARRQILVPLKAVLNYANGHRPESRDERGRTRFLTLEEVKRLIRAAMDPPATIRDPKRRLLKMIAFLLGSGATPGEMFCVRAQDINRATGEVWIRGTEAGAGKTRYRRRMVHLPPRAWELIGELPKEGRVFLSTSGKQVIPDGKRGSTVIRQFHKLCVAAGLNREVGGTDAEDTSYEKLVFYSLRHTWATWFSAQVKDLALLIECGGWSDAEMAMYYRKHASRDLGERLLAHGWDFRR